MRRMLLRSARAVVILWAFQVIPCGAFVVNESVESGLRCSYRVGGAWRRRRWQVVNAILWIGCFCFVVLFVGEVDILGPVINSDRIQKFKLATRKHFQLLIFNAYARVKWLESSSGGRPRFLRLAERSFGELSGARNGIALRFSLLS